jgi:hypothetical protein
MPERVGMVQTLFSDPESINPRDDHRLDGLMDASNLTFLEDLKAWSEICDHLTIWQYSTNCHNYLLYYPNFNALLANARLYADNHVIGVFDMSNGLYESCDFPELRSYITAKLLWDPYMSEEEYWGHIDDFLAGVYGPGWKYIRDYIDHTQELLRDVCCKCLSFSTEDDLRWARFTCGYLFPAPKAVAVHPRDTYPEEITGEMIRNYENVDWTEYWYWYGKLPDKEESGYLAYADRCFTQAMEMAETDEQKAMIEKTSIQVEYYRSWYTTKELNGGSGQYSFPTNMLNAYFKAHPDEFTAEEQNVYRTKIATFMRDQIDAVTIVEVNRNLYELCKKYNIERGHESGSPFHFDQDPETYLNLRQAAEAWW